MALIEGRGRVIWVAVAIVAIVTSTAAIARHFANSGVVADSQVVRDFFVDDVTLKQERHTAFEIPPIMTKDDRTVVMAMYCRGDDGQPKLWYLKKYPPELKAEFEEDIRLHGKPDPLLYMAKGGEALVRKPEAGSPWVKITSPEGMEVIKAPLDSQGRVAMPYMPQ
jgi:hypothetical protein